MGTSGPERSGGFVLEFWFSASSMRADDASDVRKPLGEAVLFWSSVFSSFPPPGVWPMCDIRPLEIGGIWSITYR